MYIRSSLLVMTGARNCAKKTMKYVRPYALKKKNKLKMQFYNLQLSIIVWSMISTIDVRCVSGYQLYGTRWHLEI